MIGINKLYSSGSDILGNPKDTAKFEISGCPISDIKEWYYRWRYKLDWEDLTDIISEWLVCTSSEAGKILTVALQNRLTSEMLERILGEKEDKPVASVDDKKIK